MPGWRRPPSATWPYRRPAGKREKQTTVRLSAPGWAALDWLLECLPGESQSTLIDRLVCAAATRLARGDAVPELGRQDDALE